MLQQTNQHREMRKWTKNIPKYVLYPLLLLPQHSKTPHQLRSELHSLMREEIVQNLRHCHGTHLCETQTQLSQLIQKQTVQLNLQIRLHFLIPQHISLSDEIAQHHCSHISVIVFEKRLDHTLINLLDTLNHLDLFEHLLSLSRQVVLTVGLKMQFELLQLLTRYDKSTEMLHICYYYLILEQLVHEKTKLREDARIIVQHSQLKRLHILRVILKQIAQLLSRTLTTIDMRLIELPTRKVGVPQSTTVQRKQFLPIDFPTLPRRILTLQILQQQQHVVLIPLPLRNRTQKRPDC